MIPQKSPGAGGGSVAIRGFLVQTLLALLEITQNEPPFIEITLEPAIGDEQFDFVWTDAAGTHAIQVKSTVNTFNKSDVEQWAGKMEAAHSGKECRIMLVGLIPGSLSKVTHIGAVSIEKKNLHLNDLNEQTAHRLSKFLELEGIDAGTAANREMIVHALVSQLENYSATSTPLSRVAFVKLLRQWITSAPKPERQIDISRIDKYAPVELVGRKNELALLNEAWSKIRNDVVPRPHVMNDNYNSP